MEIKDLLQQTDKLPNVPDVVHELIIALKDPDADYNAIAAKVAQDQTLSLKILRMVNSAYFGLSRKVSSIDEAVVLLGMDKLNTLVIASGLSNSATKVEGLDLKAFWQDSFMVASIASWLAQYTEEVAEDIAFTTGIIYNIGRLLLHLTAPKEAAAIQELVKEKNASRIAAEMARLNFTSQDAGKALLDQWKFPSELGVAIQQYKRPLGYDEPSPLSAVLNLANYLNNARVSKRHIDDIKDFMPKKVMQLAGIPTKLIDHIDDALSLTTYLEV